MAKVQGIDVSYHNGVIDWTKVKNAGIKFAILREGYRATIDNKFLTNAKGCIDNDIPVMVYHFLYTDNATIKENAVSTVANMKKANLSLSNTYVWVDLEYDTWTKNGEKCTKELCSQYTTEYIKYLTSLGCKKIGIYMNNDYYQNYYTDELKKNYPIWLADYSGNPDYECKIQQYGSTGKVDGMTGNVDMDYLLDSSLLQSTTTTTVVETGGNNMSVTICHASISENGNAGWDGKSAAGDQTGKEVCTRTWYNKSWTVMLLYPDAAIRAKAAAAAKKLANSNLVGYDQSQRNTLYQALKKYNFDVDKYIASGTKTETDCSAFMYACYSCFVPSMRSDSNAPATAYMRDAYKKFGFEVHTESKYLTTDANLVVGAVLVYEGHHTVMAITNGANATSSSTTVVKTSTFTQYKVKVTASDYLNMRASNNTGATIVGKLNKDHIVTIRQESDGWGKVYCYPDNKKTTPTWGWICLKYTKRV